MPDLRNRYHELVCSPAQLALCRQARSVAELLATLRALWGVPEQSDNQLLHTIDALHREDLPEAVVADMAGLWLPRRYHVRTQRLQWCLPEGPATEPFHDEYISRCCQSIVLNQLLIPKTPVQSLTACHGREPKAQPAGFIFHLSRCGSTLLSGCLSELEDAAVFSESPVLTEVLLDPALSPQEKRQHIECLINVQARLFPGRRVVVKWNAWDIFQWNLLRSLYPHVPVVALVRDPVEILASHHAQAGRHMSGDPSLAAVAPVLTTSGGSGVLEHRVRVLEGLMHGMLPLQLSSGATLFDYSQLRRETVEEIARIFHLRCDAAGQRRMAQRMQHNAKLPGTRFQPDGAAKAAVFAAPEREIIERRLGALHQRLVPPLQRVAQRQEVANAC